MGISSWRWWGKPVTGIAFTGRTLVALKNTTAASKELPEGLVDVSPVAPNIQSVRELAEIAEELLDEVGAHREAVAMALPDLAVTTKVLRGRGRASRRDLERELAPALPYGRGEARCDFWRGRHDEVLAAAIREVVASQYEQIVEAVECRLAWVDGVSLAQIPGHAAGRGVDVRLQLYRGHYALAVFVGGELVDARTKLRTPGDVELVCREVRRVPALYAGEVGGGDAIDALHVSGADAEDVAEKLGADHSVRSVRVGGDGENFQLRAALEALVERGKP